MSLYTLNLRVFWPLLTCVLAALALLHHLTLTTRSADTSAADGCQDPDHGTLSLLKYALVFALCYFFIRYCASRPAEGKRGLGRALLLEGHGKARRELLEEYYEREVRLSPHVLGHSKAHVAKLVSELVKVGRTDGPPESSLAFRGDYMQIGSSYEEHKVGSPDCFDILVPLRLPRGLTLDPVVFSERPGGPPLSTLETPRRSEWTRRHRAFTDSFLRPHVSAGVQRLSPDCVLRWFYPAAQRCLATVRYPFEQRCALSLSLGEQQRVQLRLTPRSDYVCCHISMGVRLIPAFPLGDSAFLVPTTDPRHPGEDLWAVYFPKQEQRLLGWLKGRLPSGSCHLKVLQLAKEVRDLGGQTLDNQARAEWKGVLSSYTLKTAWLRLLFSTPPEAWEERHLVDRLEDLLRSLREGLQGCVLKHLFLGGDAAGLLPDSVSLPKLVKEMAPSNLWEVFSAASLELVAARLTYTWAHLHRLIRLGRPQRSSLGRGLHCKHIEAE
ncbi:inositol 1,4,5-trisphosphate receptor-interacting protein-like 2 [Clupea harengus]|uniref:Inositol 1,4,5-trisphosphate receptor-interacting protein-like 2 n=1 Tax=Clupea harengus TaxID=7950 RepID=A0A6P3VW58_CLUHA|nr:inositol 1,4,5-trisphosphate receptor-interacting protein-like 2 [Clupea harengus]